MRETNDLFFLAATSWLLDGKLTSSDVWTWDLDDQVGYVESTNTLRYSRSVLLSLNAVWYIGRSGYTDPFVFSRGQGINGIEVGLSYEL